MESSKDATVVAQAICDEDLSQNRSSGHKSEKRRVTPPVRPADWAGGGEGGPRVPSAGDRGRCWEASTKGNVVPATAAKHLSGPGARLRPLLLLRVNTEPVKQRRPS